MDAHGLLGGILVAAAITSMMRRCSSQPARMWRWSRAARFEELGAVIPPPEAAGPQALRAHVAAEVRKWAPMIRGAGISLE